MEEQEHADECSKCGGGGELLCCETCPVAMHTACAGLARVPAGDWFCPACRSARTGIKRAPPTDLSASRKRSKPATPIAMACSIASDPGVVVVRVGARIAAMDQHGLWFAAVVLQTKPELAKAPVAALVHFDGWNKRHDLWIRDLANRIAPLDRLPALQPPLPAVPLQLAPATLDRPVSSTTLAHLLDDFEARAGALLLPFQTLPSAADFADYYTLIAQPLSLAEIRARLNEGAYSSRVALETDLLLMCANCQAYNTPASLIHRDAMALRRLIKELFRAGDGVAKMRPPLQVMPEATQRDGSTSAIEAEALQMTLAALARTGAIPVGATLTCAGRTADYCPSSASFLLRETHRPFPTPDIMRDIILRGGLSSNGWRSVVVGGRTIAQISAAAEHAVDLATEHVAARAPLQPCDSHDGAGGDARGDVVVKALADTSSYPAWLLSAATRALSSSLIFLPKASRAAVSERWGAHVFFTDAYTGAQEACFACASYLDDDTRDDFVYCVDCAEPYHTFCANLRLGSEDTLLDDLHSWRCPLCVPCDVCHRPRPRADLLTCGKCGVTSHDVCLSPVPWPAGTGTAAVAPGPRRWLCRACAQCVHCGATTAGAAPGCRWMFDFTLCQACGDLRLKGNFCPICNVIYSDDDFDTKMLQCERCERWLHAKCDGIDDEIYAALSDMPALKYECPDCRRGAHSIDIVQKVADVEHARFLELVRKQLHVTERSPKGWLFADLPTDDVFPGYGSKVAQPMCFRDVERKIDAKLYKTWPPFVADILQIFANCRLYHGNDPSSRYTKGADELEPAFLHRVAQLSAPSKLASATVSTHPTAATAAASLCRPVVSVAASVPGPGVSTMLASKASLQRRVTQPVAWPTQPVNTALSWHEFAAHPACLLPGQRPLAQAALPGAVDLGTHCDTRSVAALRSVFAGVGGAASRATAFLPWATIPLVPPTAYMRPAPMLSPPEQRLSTGPVAIRPPPVLGHPPQLHLKTDELRETTVAVVIDDERRCALCAGEGEAVGPRGGRLLSLAVLDGWVHSNCALWSAEVFETADGALANFNAALRRSRQLRCSLCHRVGATVGCCASKCTSNFHFPCAVQAGAQFLESKEVFCTYHANQRIDGIANFSLGRQIYIPQTRDKGRNAREDRVDAIMASKVPVLVRVGAFVLETIGQLAPHNDAFSGADGLVPLGYKASREFWSSAPRERCVYAMEVLERDGAPLFQVTSSEGPVYHGSSANAVWASVITAINLRLGSREVGRPARAWRAPSGQYLFGLALPAVVALIERLPGASRCPAYSPRFFQLQRDERRVLVNPTGCARTEPRARGRREFNPFPSNHHAGDMPVQDAGAGAEASRKGFGSSASGLTVPMQYRQARKVVRDTVRVLQSPIHGLGLFALRRLARGEMVIEYAGELIREGLCDAREAYYDRHHIGTYMFRVDDAMVVDATQKGNSARFINHCCEPNCTSRIISVDGVKKIVIVAQRDIEPSEEITYDYKFSIEETKIKCYCGHVNCRGFMN